VASELSSLSLSLTDGVPIAGLGGVSGAGGLTKHCREAYLQPAGNTWWSLGVVSPVTRLFVALLFCLCSPS
jgi:hypothetical protein